MSQSSMGVGAQSTYQPYEVQQAQQSQSVRQSEAAPAEAAAQTSESAPRDSFLAQAQGSAEASLNLLIEDHDGIDYTALSRVPLNAEEQMLKNAILSYPGNQATEQEAHIIAHITRMAAEHFNLDSRLLLAVFAHESKFDPDASNGGGTGLGQLTPPAIAEVWAVGVRLNEVPEKEKPNYMRHRADTRRQLSGDGRVNTQDIFRRLQNGNLRMRKDVHDNIWTSAAYLRTRMDFVSTGRSNSVDVNRMLREYNNNTEQPAIKRAYPGKVAAAYRALWGQTMPAKAENTNAR